jgi:hypothetical protein
LFLAEPLFEKQGQENLVGFASCRALGGEEEVSGELLRDGARDANAVVTL